MKTYEPLSSPIDSLHTWRLQALIWILRGQFPFWVLAYLAGIWSAVQTYRENSRQAGDNPEGLLAAVVAAYSIVMGSMAVITFVSKLGYRSRVFTMLGVYYFLSILLFGLSALRLE